MERKYSSALAIGEVFDFDLLDGFGAVVLPAGTYVSHELLDHLKQIGCSKLFAAEAEAAADQSAPVETVKEYNGSHQRALDSLAEDAPAVLEDLRTRLFDGDRVDKDSIDGIIEGYEKIVRDDADIVLAHFHTLVSNSLHSHVRSLKMSAATVVAAYQLGFSERDRRSAARAALLHDICLPSDWPRLLSELRGATESQSMQEFLQHPFHSADLLKGGFPSISELELSLVVQVHEQSDGSGYPRGIKGHLLHPLGRLINVVDAFLTLTDSSDPLGGYVASDALAYLVNHSLYGTFDRACVQALVRSAAAYPVGSEVMLSNQQTGTVMRSKKGDYLRPIVRMHSSQEAVDLSHSPHYIVQPAQPNGRRLPKSKLNRNLWRPV